MMSLTEKVTYTNTISSPATGMPTREKYTISSRSLRSFLIVYFFTMGANGVTCFVLVYGLGEQTMARLTPYP